MGRKREIVSGRNIRRVQLPTARRRVALTLVPPRWAPELAKLPWLLMTAGVIWLVSPLTWLATQVWTTEQGAIGPIILATGMWTLAAAYRCHAGNAAAGDLRRGAALIGGCIVLRLLAAVVGARSAECLATYLGLVALLSAYVGWPVVRRLWFPLAYLLFVIPPPYSLVAPATRALKLWLATSAVDLLASAGLAVASSGASMYVDQYELLIEAACTGLNSLVSLLAVGMLYVHWRHATDWRYATLLALLILPIAILANLVRIVLLLLLVHFTGAAVLESSLHPAVGLAMFTVALAALAGLDTLLSPMRARLAPRHAA